MNGLEKIACQREGLLHRLALGSGYPDPRKPTPLCRAAIALLERDEHQWPERHRMDVWWMLDKLPRTEQLAIAGALLAEEIDRLERAPNEVVSAQPDPPPPSPKPHTSNHVPAPGKRVRLKDGLRETLLKQNYLPEVAEHMGQLAGMFGRIERLNDNVGTASVTLDGQGTITEVPITALEILN